MSTLEIENETIRTFYNTINDYLYLMEDYRYRTAELRAIKSRLRNLISSSYFDDETIESVKEYNNILKDLLNKVRDTKEQFMQSSKEASDCNFHLQTAYKPNFRWDFSNVCDAIWADFKNTLFIVLSICNIIFGVKLGKAVYRKITYPPKVIEINVDSLGNKIQNEYYAVRNDSTNIVEYSPIDEAGYRMKRTYELSSNFGIVKDGNDLSKIDLSGLNPTQELVYDEATNRISVDTYRTFHYIKSDNNISIEDRNIDNSSKVIGIILGAVAGLFMSSLIAISLFELLDTETPYLDIYEDILDYLERLIEYRKYLKDEAKKMKLAESEEETHGKLFDLLCSQIDIIIKDFTSKLSISEAYKLRRISDNFWLSDEKIINDYAKEKDSFILDLFRIANNLSDKKTEDSNKEYKLKR